MADSYAEYVDDVLTEKDSKKQWEAEGPVSDDLNTHIDEGLRILASKDVERLMAVKTIKLNVLSRVKKWESKKKRKSFF